ncbi:hypothetical protein SEUBUCD646_0L04050 [Saccharomyces eubayanus]|uniref:Uncharacterized protein n=2 Tax=Saccharomyces TaxID=4930 RepID=A0ABN8VK62_SACEU|nr:hypothetical protein DI49_3864 [Saccharomyces eubayanus]KOG98036.1 hypothetical protein DI49_3864 [Saccharomyces eubayanus]CAI1601146.1 hypothetical protein SEUBUCD650_0L04040 [Saccharomyces eubayanus]CAI1627716.1 hypothetical protein SEUBUCD646_0L04050 [Saccharomyces eubayanus]
MNCTNSNYPKRTRPTKMPQKPLKVTKKVKDPRRVTKKQKNLRKAAPLQLKSKKKSLQYMKKLRKSSSLTETTERLVASKVGHLELLRGTRKELEKGKKASK